MCVLVQCEDVSEDLGRVPEGRKCINDGNGGMSGHFLRVRERSTERLMPFDYLNFRMVANAGKYSLRHATKDVDAVTNAFVDPKLDILLAQEQCFPTQKGGSSFRCYARAGTPLGK